MANHETSHHGHVHDFDAERARRYDQIARQTLAGYEDLHHMASTLLGVELGEAVRVLTLASCPFAKPLRNAVRSFTIQVNDSRG